MSEGQIYCPLPGGFIEGGTGAELPVLSERGLILICCFVFCAMFWSLILFWLFG